MKQYAFYLALAVTLSTLSGCASKPPKDTTLRAAEKPYQGKDMTAPWRIGGVFDKKDKSVTIAINGDNVIRASFPPFTPNVNAATNYEGKAIATACKFATGIISDNGRSKFGIAQMIVQKSTGNTANTCDVSVDGEQAVTLYF